MRLSEWGLKPVITTHFPTFTPNDYLFTEYAKTVDGGEKMEKWEIFAHAVNEIIREGGSLGINEQSTKDRLDYQKFLAGKKNEITVNGKTFQFPHTTEKTTYTEEKKNY